MASTGRWPRSMLPDKRSDTLSTTGFLKVRVISIRNCTNINRNAPPPPSLPAPHVLPGRAFITRSCGGRGVFGVPAPLENKGDSGTRPRWQLRLNTIPMDCSGGSVGGSHLFYWGLVPACLWGFERGAVHGRQAILSTLPILVVQMRPAKKHTIGNHRSPCSGSVVGEAWFARKLG